MKVVVTGGAGFIGSHLVRTLVKRGDDVHVVDDLWSGKHEHVPQGAVFHNVDTRDTDALAQVFSGAAAVFHLAARPRVPYTIEYPKESHDVNVNGTLSVLLAAVQAAVGRIVFASSSAVYGDQETASLVEDMEPHATNPYALHKHIGEQYVRLFAQLYNLPAVSLRYFNVYGPGMDPEGGYALAIPRFISMRTRGEALTITGDGSQTRDFVHVDDVVRANLIAAASPSIGKGEVINIGTGRSVSINELAKLIGGERVYIPARAEAKHMRADVVRAKELLGWQPSIKLEDGITSLLQEAKLI